MKQRFKDVANKSFDFLDKLGGKRYTRDNPALHDRDPIIGVSQMKTNACKEYEIETMRFNKSTFARNPITGERKNPGNNSKLSSYGHMIL